MDILIGILTVVEVLVCLLLILIVLMQRPRQEGLGASFGDGMMSQIAGAQTTNVLQKFTVYLAVALFILTLTLALLITRQQSHKANTRIFDAPPPPAAVETPKIEVKPEGVKPAPAAEAPKTGDAAKPSVEPSAPTKPLVEAVKEGPKPVAPAAEAPKPAPVPAPAASTPVVEAPKPVPAASAPAPVTPAPVPVAPATPAAPAPKP